MKRYGLHWKWKYKAVLYGVFDGDEHEYYIRCTLRTKRPRETDIEKLLNRYRDNYRGFDGLILKITDMAELTVFDAYSF